ncbi:DUF547 domain-containing protein [Chloroflexota bacterium]
MPDTTPYSLKDTLVKIRDSLFNRLTGVEQDLVLNPLPSQPVPPQSSGLAAEIKMAIDEFKTSAVDQSGFKVDYAGLRDTQAYAEYQRSCTPRLRKFDPASLRTPEESLAFWINLYNALVIDGIISYNVQESVTEGRLGIVKFFRRVAYQVGGQRISLDDIEHGVLRGNKGHPFLPGSHFPSDDPRLDWVVEKPDARIHFALNCASRSCPPIRTYNAADINQQLEMASRNFVDTNLTIDYDRLQLTTSEIFHWFQADFGGKVGVLDFLQEHLLQDERQTWLETNLRNVKIQYEPYDWGLNMLS